jgi:ethanolamine utilization microcompartment shell protein EutS
MSASAVELGFLDDFLGPRVLVFDNDFEASSSPCTMKISVSAVELGFEDDFSDSRDFVFINGLSVSSSLYAQKISTSSRTGLLG